MADSSESRPVVKSTKPVSEALLNEKVSASTSSELQRDKTFCSFRGVIRILSFSSRPARALRTNAYPHRRIANHTIDDVTVGSRHFVHAHSVRTRSVLRYRFLRSPIQAKSMARVGWVGLWSRTRLGRGRWSVELAQRGEKRVMA